MVFFAIPHGNRGPSERFLTLEKRNESVDARGNARILSGLNRSRCCPRKRGAPYFWGMERKPSCSTSIPAVGASINASLSGQLPPRPLTHDLYLLTLQAFGAKVSRAVIVNMENEVYYARLILEAENEIMERKIIELDARPSDCLALSVRCGAPFYVVRKLWDSLEDMSGVLAEMRENEGEGDKTP